MAVSTYWFVSKLLGQSPVGSAELIQLHSLAAALGILDLDRANAVSAQLARIEVSLGQVCLLVRHIRGLVSPERNLFLCFTE